MAFHYGLGLNGSNGYSAGCGGVAVQGNRASGSAAFRSATAASDIDATVGRGGLFGVSRSSSDGYRRSWKKNHKAVGSTPANAAVFQSYPVVILGNNGSGGPTSFAPATATVSFVAAGLPMPDAASDVLQDAIVALLTAFGGTPS